MKRKFTLKSEKKWKSPKFQEAEDNELPGVQKCSGSHCKSVRHNQDWEAVTEIVITENAQFATAQQLDFPLRRQEDA